MIRTYKAIVHIAASMVPGGKDPVGIIRGYLEHLSGLGIHVDSIQLDPPDQETPSAVDSDDLIKLTEHNTV